MKKLFLTAIAATMLTAPSLGAQAAPVVPTIKIEAQAQTVNHVRDHRVIKKTIIKRKANGTVVKKVVTKHRWARGKRVPGWQRYRPVDYHRYHLRRPDRGHHWVRVDNDFLLVAVGTGLIASVIAAH